MPGEEQETTNNELPSLKTPKAHTDINNDQGQGDNIPGDTGENIGEVPKSKIKKVRVKKQKPAPAPKPPREKKSNSEKNRVTVTTVIYNSDEFPEYRELNKILEARKAEGMTRDMNHLIRQCVDFCVNYNHFQKQGMEQNFGVPDDTPLITFKDAFTNQ